MDEVDAIVIGAGVVGLAIARNLAMSGWETIIVEANASIGMETSSRNSEVIHAGLYYPAGSLKARLCVSGRKLLYDFCEAHAVRHRRIGKIIFATTSDEHSALEAIEQSAQAAGVDDLQRLDRVDLSRLEPALSHDAALLSPSTGIIDSHGFMQALLGDAQAHGAQLALRTRITRAARERGAWAVYIEGEDGPVARTRYLINAAGLGAQAVAGRIEELAPRDIPPLHLAKGVYFSCRRKLPFRHLLYPVPVPGGLGTHLTFDLSGGARFGPDVEWIDQFDYRVDADRRTRFVQAARQIYPDLEDEDLEPAYAGIRPKITGPGTAAADFVIATPRDHAVEGLVNLFGIESPGLTSSLAIAEHVGQALQC